MKNKLFWIALILITFIAIFPRLMQLYNASNYYFLGEQGVEYQVTKSIVVDHKIVLTAHQGGFGDFQKPSGFNYLLAIPFIVGGGDPFAGRTMMFLLSLLTVSLGFILIYRMFGLRTAILTSFLMAISPNLKDYIGGIL